MKKVHPNMLRSLTRLLLGGALIGLDELQWQLQQWEHAVDRVYSSRTTTQPNSQTPTATDIPATLPTVASNSKPDAPATTEPPAPPSIVQAAPNPATLLRHALIGLLFDTEARIETGLAAITQLDQALGALAVPLIQPLQTTPVLAPARAEFEKLVTRGAAEVDRWIELGREEERHSRLLTKTAGRMTFETSIHQVAINPEVQALVQQQGIGLANEVVKEVRERAVSADTLFERLARSMFKLTPREKLPEPPAAVRIRAEQIHDIDGYDPAVDLH